MVAVDDEMLLGVGEDLLGQFAKAGQGHELSVWQAADLPLALLTAVDEAEITLSRASKEIADIRGADLEGRV
jgi:hypothetical protein